MTFFINSGRRLSCRLQRGRYRTFLGSGLLQAEGFRLAWNAMREEAGRDPAGVFSAAAGDAPGEPRAEDRQEADSVRLCLQRLCTCEGQRTRRRESSRRMTALGVSDPIRIEWDNSAPGELWSTSPGWRRDAAPPPFAWPSASTWASPTRASRRRSTRG